MVIRRFAFCLVGSRSATQINSIFDLSGRDTSFEMLLDPETIAEQTVILTQGGDELETNR